MYKERKKTIATSLSLSIHILDYIDKLIARGDFLTRSEYMRYLIQSDKDLREGIR